MCLISFWPLYRFYHSSMSWAFISMVSFWFVWKWPSFNLWWKVMPWSVIWEIGLIFHCSYIMKTGINYFVFIFSKSFIILFFFYNSVINCLLSKIWLISPYSKATFFIIFDTFICICSDSTTSLLRWERIVRSTEDAGHKGFVQWHNDVFYFLLPFYCLIVLSDCHWALS